jgi:hypothetical protein
VINVWHELQLFFSLFSPTNVVDSFSLPVTLIQKKAEKNLLENKANKNNNLLCVLIKSAELLQPDKLLKVLLNLTLNKKCSTDCRKNLKTFYSTSLSPWKQHFYCCKSKIINRKSFLSPLN